MPWQYQDIRCSIKPDFSDIGPYFPNGTQLEQRHAETLILVFLAILITMHLVKVYFSTLCKKKAVSLNMVIVCYV